MATLPISMFFIIIMIWYLWWLHVSLIVILLTLKQSWNFLRDKNQSVTRIHQIVDKWIFYGYWLVAIRSMAKIVECVTLLSEKNGHPISNSLMYNDVFPIRRVESICLSSQLCFHIAVCVVWRQSCHTATPACICRKPSISGRDAGQRTPCNSVVQYELFTCRHFRLATIMSVVGKRCGACYIFQDWFLVYAQSMRAALLCNDVSHWLDANLVWAMHLITQTAEVCAFCISVTRTSNDSDNMFK